MDAVINPSIVADGHTQRKRRAAPAASAAALGMIPEIHYTSTLRRHFDTCLRKHAFVIGKLALLSNIHFVTCRFCRARYRRSATGSEEDCPHRIFPG